MRSGIDRLPERLDAAAELDWRAALARPRRGAHSLVTIGRGPTLAIAREAALKLKETCNLHAEAFSGAEFQHGPVALVEPAYPVLLFMPADAGRRRHRDAAHRSARARALACSRPRAVAGPAFLPTLAPDHPDADAICLIQSFYQLLLQRRGAPRQRRRPAASPAEGDAHPMNASAQFAVAADCVFDGETLHRHAAVVVEGARIARSCRAADIGDAASLRCRKAPGSRPGSSTCRSTAAATCCSTMRRPREAIPTIAAAHRRFGTTGLLPTLITDQPGEDHGGDRRRAGSDAHASPRCSVFISKGPFLSPRQAGRARSGADPRAHACGPRRCSRHRAAARSSSRSRPSGCRRASSRGSRAADIRVCLGHSMATYAQTRAALAEGLTGFTHLFNAMRPLESREPRPDRGGAGNARLLVRPDRRRRACRSRRCSASRCAASASRCW